MAEFRIKTPDKCFSVQNFLACTEQFTWTIQLQQSQIHGCQALVQQRYQLKHGNPMADALNQCRPQWHYYTNEILRWMQIGAGYKSLTER